MLAFAQCRTGADTHPHMVGYVVIHWPGKS
jgi:hypothetical protein